MILAPRSRRCPVPLPLSWSHDGAAYRVTPWPDVQFERRYGTEWVPVEPTPEVLRVSRIAGGSWRAYTEFVPGDVRELLQLVQANRLAALTVAARCPGVVGLLNETPALTAFVAAHAVLRGSDQPTWGELNAICERAGLFGLLDWLGLPATHQALAILRNLVAPDLTPALLEPLRALLWRPQGIFALAQLTTIGERELTDACALAA